jgi:hypothetical protein
MALLKRQHCMRAKLCFAHKRQCCIICSMSYPAMLQLLKCMMQVDRKARPTAALNFFALPIPASEAKRAESPVDIANTILVRNMRFASEKLAQKRIPTSRTERVPLHLFFKLFVYFTVAFWANCTMFKHNAPIPSCI